MKKVNMMIAVVVIFIIGLGGCKKECTSTCGTITNDDILENGCYSLTIQNDCSGNRKTFCFDQSTWFTSYVGDDFCVTNVAPW